MNAQFRQPAKSAAINPLKMSAPLGAAMAFMGIDRCMPLLHGSQGCTAFGLVLLVRHFREQIPFQTTAMNEVTTILGGLDNLEQAVLNINNRAQPDLIGICTTGLTETRGEDIAGDLKLIRQRHPELADLALVGVNTPDFKGALQDGWAAAVQAMVEQLVEPAAETVPTQVNVLAGCHLTPGDIEAVRDMVEAFGLTPIILPDISGSLDGHVPDAYRGTTYGGTKVADVRRMGASAFTFAIGEQMRGAAEALAAKCGTPYQVFDRLTGLGAVDTFIEMLSAVSGQSVPNALRRQRSQLVDAMLDGHFFFGERKIAVAAEPDLLLALSCWLSEMGAEVSAAVTSTTMSDAVLARLPAAELTIGDLDDFETAAARLGCELLLTHSHGRGAAERLGLPLYRVGFPQFDRLGAAHRVTVGYRGTRDLIFDVGNLLMEHAPHDVHPPRRDEDHASLTTH